jgi:hypothetical protein
MTQLKKLFSSYEESRDPFAIVEKVRQEMRDNHDKITAPLGLSGHERFQLLKGKLDDGVEIYNTMFRPKLHTKLDLARLVGTSVKPLLTEHKARMEEVNKEQNVARTQRENALNQVLEPFFFLTGEKSKIKDLDYDRLNQPTTASDFIKSMLLDSLTGAAMKQEMEELDERYGLKPGMTIEERNKIIDSTDYVAKLTELQKAVRFNLETGEGAILDEILPVVDDFTRFHEEVETLRAKRGGLSGADPEVLRRLDRTARDLRERAKPLMEHAQSLQIKYSGENMGPIREFSYALQSAGVLITARTNAYLQSSGAGERLQRELGDVVREGQETIKSVMEHLEELAREPQPPKVPWATPELQALLRNFPELEEHVGTLEPGNDVTLTGARTLVELMVPLLATPVASQLFARELERLLEEGHELVDAQPLARARAEVTEAQLEELLGPALRDIDAFFAMSSRRDERMQPSEDGMIPSELWQEVSETAQRALEAAAKLRAGLDRLVALVGDQPGPVPALLREVTTRIESQARTLLESLPPSTNPFDDPPSLTVSTTDAPTPSSTTGGTTERPPEQRSYNPRIMAATSAL